MNFVMVPSTANTVPTNVTGKLHVTDMDAAAVMGAVNVSMAITDKAVIRLYVQHQFLETLVALRASQMKIAAATVDVWGMALASASDYLSHQPATYANFLISEVYVY